MPTEQLTIIITSSYSSICMDTYHDPSGRAGASIYTQLDYHHHHSPRIDSFHHNKLFRDFFFFLLFMEGFDYMTSGSMVIVLIMTRHKNVRPFLPTFNIDK